MKYLSIIGLLIASVCLSACSEDELDDKSIFTSSTTEQNELDKWLHTNFVTPYNLSFSYKYEDKESYLSYNLIPADYDKAVALALMMKHVWLDTYVEVAGGDFLKANCPRVLQLFGSPAYNPGNGGIVLGTAEGGVKVYLFNVNMIDIDNPYIDIDSPFPSKDANTTDLNYWFFHTMHHEFTHILQQTKNYSTDFNLISAADYKADDWLNLDDEDAPLLGFVSGYASKEANEDFAEILSTYITRTEEAWQQLLEAGVNPRTGDDSGKQAILAKLEIVRDYMKGSWEMDIDELREVVIRRSKEIAELDLRTLN